MNDIDLRKEKCGGSWTRRFGEHEVKGFDVSVNDVSAHVTMRDIGIKFHVDRGDIPAAWGTPIDVDQLHAELINAAVVRMTGSVLKELFRTISFLRNDSFRDGEHAVRKKIKEALGL